MSETKTATIRVEYVQKVTSVIDRLNRRATRLGLDPIQVRISVPYLKPFKVAVKNSEETKEIFVNFVDVTFTLNIPKLSDWSFIAAIQHTDGGNLLNTVPGVEKLNLDLSKFRACSSGCEHCGLERNRVDTYVVSHPVQGLKQVGKTCLASFTGYGGTPEHAAKVAEWLSDCAHIVELGGGADDDDREEYGSGKGDGFDLNYFLAFVAKLSKDYGYTTRKQADETCRQSTPDQAIGQLFPSYGDSKFVRVIPTEEDIEEARRARLWASKLDAKTDFQHNLKVIANNDGCLFRNAGVAGYIIPAYRSHLEGEVKRAMRKPSVHVGQPGEKLKALSVIYTGSASFDSAYGTCFIHRFSTPEGSDLIWKTGTSVDLTAGDKLLINATVKKHDTYRERAQTSLLRVKF